MSMLIGLHKYSTSRKITLVQFFFNHLVISCSNDTTIKLWDLTNLKADPTSPNPIKIRSSFTLHENTDYVRGIEYNS